MPGIFNLIIAVVVCSCAPRDVIRTPFNVISSPIQKEKAEDIIKDELLNYNIKLKLIKIAPRLWFMISPHTREGRILLTGNIENKAQQIKIKQAIWSVGGVKEIIDHMIMQENSGLSGYLSDALIATKARVKILLDPIIPYRDFSIIVKDGNLFIMGVIENKTDLIHLLGSLSHIKGVKKVTSYIRVSSIDPFPSHEKVVEYDYIKVLKDKR